MFDLYMHIEDLGRRAGYKNMTALCAAAGVPRTTMSELKRGRSKGLSTATAWKLAGLLELPLDVICPPPEGIVNPAERLTVTELSAAKKYRALDEHGKNMVELVLEEELRRMQRTARRTETRVIPLFGVRFAAGPGEPDTGAPWEDYAVPAESRGEFAVRISGDSMEPELRDGQIALCAKRRPEQGEVAVMLVNGAFYVKQFISDGRNIFLRSLNRKRADADLDIWESGSDSVQCFGTVLLDKRPPLAEE
jgi:SOS-response transcriptional repressor LexA